MNPQAQVVQDRKKVKVTKSKVKDDIKAGKITVEDILGEMLERVKHIEQILINNGR